MFGVRVCVTGHRYRWNRLLAVGPPKVCRKKVVKVQRFTVSYLPFFFPLQDSTRELSLEVITGLCESAPSVFREGGGGIVGAVVPLTINLLAQPPEGTADSPGAVVGSRIRLVASSA